MLHSMTIRLIQVDQLQTLYLCYGVKCQSGVVWGHRGQKFIFTKYAITRPCYTWPYKTHTCTSPWDLLLMLWGQMSFRGHLGSLVSKGHFHWKCYNLSMLHSMTIRLTHVDKLETLLWLYRVKSQSGVIWGHWGQKVICTKNAITRPCYILGLIHVHQFETLYLYNWVKC